MSLVLAKENAILDEMLGNASLFPATVYIGLMTAAPNDDGTGVVEPSGGSYARKAVTNNLTEWPAAVGGQKSNANAVVFATATAGWGTITHFGIFDAVSAGNLLAYGALNTPRTVLASDDFQFNAAALVVELD